MHSSSGGSESLLERAGSLHFAKTRSEDIFRDMGEEVVGSVKEGERVKEEEGENGDICFTFGLFVCYERPESPPFLIRPSAAWRFTHVGFPIFILPVST